MSLLLGRLAEPLERLAETGPADFYQGEIARSIVADTRAGGGVLSAEDLGSCRAHTVPSLEIPYRGVTFQTTSGMTAGPTLAGIFWKPPRREIADAPHGRFFQAPLRAPPPALSHPPPPPGGVENCSPSPTPPTLPPPPPAR